MFVFNLKQFGMATLWLVVMLPVFAFLHAIFFFIQCLILQLTGPCVAWKGTWALVMVMTNTTTSTTKSASAPSWGTVVRGAMPTGSAPWSSVRRLVATGKWMVNIQPLLGYLYLLVQLSYHVLLTSDGRKPLYLSDK